DTFARQHPGGSRLILDAQGTDITEEMNGQGNFLGSHRHSNVAWTTALTTLAVGLIVDDVRPPEKSPPRSVTNPLNMAQRLTNRRKKISETFVPEESSVVYTQP
ncbi:unnamed protein product, partial [Choristocarpus tenellus]